MCHLSSTNDHGSNLSALATGMFLGNVCSLAGLRNAKVGQVSTCRLIVHCPALHYTVLAKCELCQMCTVSNVSLAKLKLHGLYLAGMEAQFPEGIVKGLDSSRMLRLDATIYC